MSSPALNPDLDLAIARVIRAPRERVWRAWTEPAQLAQWWVPAPMRARIDTLDVRPGGGFVTALSENGTDFTPHTDNVFLVVDEARRLVFTNAVTSGWRPASPEPVSMTAEILFDDHAEGTEYRAIVRHRDTAARTRHEDLGFFEGWGTVTEALAVLAERPPFDADAV